MVNEEKLLELASDAAEDAGKHLLKLFRGYKLKVWNKYDYPGSLVTNADKEAEKIIVNRIRRSGIPSTVVSEEAGRLGFGSRETVWAVDPLDGTLNFVKRIPYFAVSIGILVNNRTVAGVIYNPVLEESFTAIRGQGACLNGRKTHVSRKRTLRNSYLIFDWWNSEPSIPDPMGLLSRIYHFTRRLRSPGSVALNLCSIAAGRFDGAITVFRRSPIFETAAGCLIVKEAAGKITNSSGKSWESFSESILAGNPTLHGHLLSLVQGRAD